MRTNPKKRSDNHHIVSRGKSLENDRSHPVHAKLSRQSVTRCSTYTRSYLQASFMNVGLMKKEDYRSTPTTTTTSVNKRNYLVSSHHYLRNRSFSASYSLKRLLTRLSSWGPPQVWAPPSDASLFCTRSERSALPKSLKESEISQKF